MAMIERCMQCGRCSASCPAAERMDMPPHQWVSRARNGDMAAVQSAEAVWLCVGCYCCVARCPRGVRPVNLAEEARAFNTRKKDYEVVLLDDVSQVNSAMPQQLWVAALRKKR